ncbi:terpene synthase family protein [Archangium lansingense]|uniref:Terpene synthase family protein n=1 Tax=Archangium lansingense TaxID=2995310 RepID=A0ABT4A0B1_9BACT|nr:terpene synthase family protein [Archangium lansinium]MCY1074407.1 terpene synthase family protein [Archangium lansinium]
MNKTKGEPMSNISPGRIRSPMGGSFTIVSAEAAASLPRDDSARLQFRVPEAWRSPVARNPFAGEAQGRVLEWFAALGCTSEELERARAFDIAGYVGVPFPMLSQEKTVLFARFLSLWLLWDDMHVENLEHRWRIGAEHVLTGRRPPEMTRFDEGWWQLFEELAAGRSARWSRGICQAMATWSDAAVEEATAMRHYGETGVPPRFERQLELRSATIGMYVTLYLLESGYETELPYKFHQQPTVRRLNLLANELVGVGNDIFSFAKDQAQRQPNLVSTLMAERGLSVEEAIQVLIRRHDEAIIEFDQLARLLGSGARTDLRIHRWLRDVRYATLGFSLWEAQAPRYTSYKVVVRERAIEPMFAFV